MCVTQREGVDQQRTIAGAAFAGAQTSFLAMLFFSTKASRSLLDIGYASHRFVKERKCLFSFLFFLCETLVTLYITVKALFLSSFFFKNRKISFHFFGGESSLQEVSEFVLEFFFFFFHLKRIEEKKTENWNVR